ncbi:GbsR/MarR family transcriptional regulator [Nocardia sp. SC052]|uniref:GbsR/MarR family transcriptional regulator n=1 Tax=Nocardia sichangensis TaxID=3385975 RepID=UPI0039A07149
MPGDDQQNDTLRWIERVAAFCVEEWGLTPITGRILGLLMICDPPEQSAGQIADAIHASRASLTSNMRLLTTIGLIRKVRIPGERTAYYRIEDNAWYMVIQQKVESLASFGKIAEDGLQLVEGADLERTNRIRSAQKALTWLRDVAAQHRFDTERL